MPRSSHETSSSLRVANGRSAPTARVEHLTAPVVHLKSGLRHLARQSPHGDGGPHTGPHAVKQEQTAHRDDSDHMAVGPCKTLPKPELELSSRSSSSRPKSVRPLEEWTFVPLQTGQSCHFRVAQREHGDHHEDLEEHVREHEGHHEDVEDHAHAGRHKL